MPKKDTFSNLGEGELSKKLATLRDDLRAIKFKAEGARSKNVKEVQTMRRNIARVLTAINSK